MEYIDNSIDSAERYFDNPSNSYSKDVLITLSIDKNKVIFEDNCTGIRNFKKIVESIGSSDKRGNSWTNGQFGYGIYSFMAACNCLKITSKQKSDIKANEIVINRKSFDVSRQEDVSFESVQKTHYKNESGTTIEITDFDRNMWQLINFDKIVEEVEQHFELLLKRKKLQIEITVGSKKHICKPFNYARFNGEVYSNVITELSYTKGTKQLELINDKVSPIKIYLKITKEDSLKRPPFFVSKGRRVVEINKTDKFESRHKSDLWKHPNITGYIDLSDTLQPTMARNGYKNTYTARAFFNTLEGIEPDILKILKKVNKDIDQQHYQAFEEELNKVLAGLAALDEMNFKHEFVSGEDINLMKGAEGVLIKKEFTSNDKTDSDNTDEFDEMEVDLYGFDPLDIKGKDMSKETGDNDIKSNQESGTDTDYKGGELLKSGFDIRLVDGKPPTDVGTGNLIRSQLVGDTIQIFREHSDFETRVDRSRSKKAKITTRLITYISNEIAVHYKDRFFEREDTVQYSKQILEDLSEFFYKVEGALCHLSGKDLSSINS